MPVSPGPQSYHELGMAILEGAPGVPVGLLLAVHHAALHSILDLGRGTGSVSGQPGPQARWPPCGAPLQRTERRWWRDRTHPQQATGLFPSLRPSRALWHKNEETWSPLANTAGPAGWSQDKDLQWPKGGTWPPGLSCATKAPSTAAGRQKHLQDGQPAPSPAEPLRAMPSLEGPPSCGWGCSFCLSCPHGQWLPKEVEIRGPGALSVRTQGRPQGPGAGAAELHPAHD